MNSLFAIDEEEAYRNGLTIYEVRIKKTGNGWLAILKAVRQGKLLVAFVGASGLHGVLFNVGTSAEDGELRWLPDKYPPRRQLAQLGLFP